MDDIETPGSLLASLLIDNLTPEEKVVKEEEFKKESKRVLEKDDTCRVTFE